jgi:uncharacterized protein YmfQ (DUF2313 family)
MAVTATAARMLATLPSYEQDDPLIQRIIQARANEVDRADAIIDQLALELQPGAASDAFGLLGMWEAHLELPVRPSDATLNQRRAKVTSALQQLDSGSSADAMDALEAATGVAITVQRDTPDPLIDTVNVPYTSDTYNAAVVTRLARRAWPAHRGLLFAYEGGFLLDSSPLDASSL